jgi:hypothetical protein
MIKAIMLVPVRDNEGKPFRRSIWQQLELRLLQFGGFTRTTGVYGIWESEGRIYQDRSRRYEVALASWTQVAAWLEAVHWVQQAFRQEAIYIEIARIPEIISS